MPALTLPPALVSCEQAAEYLGTTAGTLAVWRCNRRYDLPYVKVGKSVRYRLADLERFIESRTVSPVTSPAE
jgi:excisionase family DNA binding protein